MNFDHFGFIAPFYERFIPPREPEQLMRIAGLPISGALLDAGGGTGRVAQTLRNQASQVVVADLSWGMLRQAVGKHQLAVVQTHTECLPFSNGYFERIIMVDALHHVCDHADTAAELWRVLKPGGRIVIEEPDVRNISVKFVAVAEKLALMRSHFISPPRIASLFSGLGSRVEIFTEEYNAWVVVEKT